MLSLPVSPVQQAEIVNIECALVERLRADRARIPPYPAIAAKLQRLAEDDRVAVRTIVEVVGADPTLSAAVLRAASSVVTAGGRGPLCTLDAAVVRLGARGVLEIALATGVGKTATATGPLSALRRDVWRSALVAARVCQTLASRRGISPDIAYIAGLLHDFGAVVLVATLEDVANQRRLAILPVEAWTDLVTRFHVEFGMVVAERWGLAAPIADVITRHHDPDVIGGQGLVSLVALADKIVARLDRGIGLGAAPELAAIDHQDVERIILKIGGELASLEGAMPAAETAAATPSLIEPRRDADGGWPCELLLSTPQATGQLTTVWPDQLSFQVGRALQTNWITSVVLHGDPDPLEMFVNVRSCEASGRGDFTVVAQPFGLAGPPRAAWIALVETARHRASDVEVRFK